MPVHDYIRMIGPEFNSVGDDAICDWMEFCRPFVSKKQFGNLFNQAMAYFVCHRMKMAGLGENILSEMTGSSSGDVGTGYSATSVSDGGTSISFASSGVGNITTDAELAQTVYGAQFLQIRKMVIMPIHISGEGDFVV